MSRMPDAARPPDPSDGPPRRFAPGLVRFGIVVIAALSLACGASPGTEVEPGRSLRSDAGDPGDLFDYLPGVGRLEIGDTVPGIPLITANGETADLSGFRGKAVVLAFVGADEGNENDEEMKHRLEELCRTLAPRLSDRIHVLTLVLDEASDRSTTAHWPQPPPGLAVPWSFVRAAPGDTARLAAAFGVIIWKHGDGRLGHSFNTAIIDPEGRLADHFPGLGPWSPRDLAAATALAARR